MREFEKATIGEANIAISDLVKSIFKSFNQVVDKAEDFSKQVVSSAANINVNITKDNSKRQTPSFEILKNETFHLG